MKQPNLIEQFSDNGDHSHWHLINENAEVIWSSDPVETIARGEKILSTAEGELSFLSADIHKNAVDKGFWDEKGKDNISEKLMLIVSELAEAMEADRKGKWSEYGSLTGAMKEEKRKYFEMEDFETRGLDQETSWQTHEPTVFKRLFVEHVKDTFEDELADAFIRILDLAKRYNIDLMWHVIMKHRFNTMRPYKHGKKILKII